MLTLSNTTSSAPCIRPLRRAILLAGVAGLSMAAASPGHAQALPGDAFVYLPEGETRQGDVQLPQPDGRIVLDLTGGRLDQATGMVDLGATANSPALLTGDLDISSGGPSLWMRAQGEATTSLFEGAASLPDGRVFAYVGYEASGNDTVLTLTAPIAGGNSEMEQTVDLGGDGTVILDAVINTTATEDRTGIRVRPISTSAGLGEGGDGKVDLVIRANVSGRGNNSEALVEAAAADRIRVTSNATISTSSGTALNAGSAETVIDAGASVLIRETSLPTIDGSAALRTSGTVDNLGTISGINTRAAAGNRATALDATNATIANRRNGGQIGKIQASGDAIVTRGNTLIQNDGEISSLFGSAVQAQGIDSTTVLRNNAQGLIRVGSAFESTGTSTTAYTGTSGTDVIVNEGTIAGDVLLGGGNDIFLVKGNGTVTGLIDGGAGEYDAFGRSYSESATVTLANNSLNVGGRQRFDMHGIEAAGAGTVVTVNADSILNDGLQMIGDGTVVNTARIEVFGPSYGSYIRDIANVAGNGTFVNRGSIVANGSYALRSESAGGVIRNEGSLGGQLGVLIDADADASGEVLDFVNTGNITATAIVANTVNMFIDKVGHVSRITNGTNGTIAQLAQGGANDAAFALNVRSRGRVELANAGAVVARSRTDGGARVEAASIDINNSGTIEGSGAGGNGLTVIATGSAQSGDPEVVASVRNTGTIRANGGRTLIDNAPALGFGFGAQIVGDNAIVELENEGIIEATGEASVAVLVHANNSDGSGRAQFQMRNTGTIRGSGTDIVYGVNDVPRRTAMEIPDALGDGDIERTVASAIQTYGTTDDIVNEGTIIGNVDLADGDDRFENRGTVEGDVRLGEGNDTYVFALGSTLTGTAFGGDGFDRLLIDGSGNQSGRLDAAQYRGFELIEGLAGVPQGTGTLSVVGAFDVDTVGIANLSIQIDAGDTVSSEGDVTFTGSNGAERITNFGTIAGGIDMGAGDDVVINAGAIQGDVLLDAGNDRYVARAGSSVTGVIDGGDGIDTFEFLLDGDIGEFPSDVVNFESYAARGQGTINVTLDQDIDTIELLEGANLVLNDGAGTIRNILGDDSDNIVTITGTLTGGVSLGGGEDTLNLTLAGVLSGALDGGAGDDTLNLTLTGASTINGLTGFETTNVSGDSPLTLAGTLGAGQTLNFDGSDNELIIAAGATFDGIVNGGDGRDLLRIQSGAADSRTVVASQIVSFEDLVAEGAGTLALTGGAYSFETVSVEGALELGANTSLASAGGVQFGAGDNRLRLASGATITGGVDGGDGDDLLQLEQAQGTVRSLRALGATGFERLESSGAGELQIDIDSVFDSVGIDGGRVTVAAGTTLTASVTGGAGNDTLAVLGNLVGDVDLGAGDDRLILGSHGAGNSYSGGAGTDTLELRIASTYENPFELAAGMFVDFERLDVGSGVVSVTADTTWDGIAITGGRLIGQAGTTITSASPILVSAGATFGSAGTVNADIDVRGTLSPGASPGTMTVNGDVIFRTGSNLFLEVSPTLSDLLNISGSLTIETGTSIDITGALQAAPGELLDLVVAQGGIEGRFTTINKSDTVFGFVVQNGNRIQIRSEFENNAALPSNVRASVDYSNQVLRAGYGVQAYTAALPLLTDAQGRVNAAAFAQLTPEAYGSAMQLGVEAGLTLADGTREIAAQQPVRDGLFLFAQTALSRTDLDGNARTGASAADIDSNAFFGGLGYGFGGNMQVGAFAGTIDGTQVLAPLGAITDSDTLALGAFADARFGGFGVYAMVAWLNGDAATTRTIAPAPSAAVGEYDLDGWVADLSVDYRFDLGGVSIAPRVGLTYVETRRDAVAETGAGAFALSVDGDRQSTLFGDAAVRLSTMLPAGGLTLHPYVEAGVRTILDGQQTLVAGRFTGAPGAPILVDGVERDRVTARLATGLGIDLAPSVRLNVGYAAELGQVDRGTLSGGLTIRF